MCGVWCEFSINQSILFPCPFELFISIFISSHTSSFYVYLFISFAIDICTYIYVCLPLYFSLFLVNFLISLYISISISLSLSFSLSLSLSIYLSPTIILISLSFMHSCCLHICRFLHGRSARPEMRARFCARPCRAQYHPYIIDRVIQIY